MAGPKLFDRVLMSVSGNPGTSTVTLGSAITGYQSFGELSNGDTCDIVIYSVDANGNPNGSWEVQRAAVYTSSGTTFARTSGNVVDGSSGPGTLVNFSSGTQYCGLVLPSSFLSDIAHFTGASSSLVAYLAGRLCFPTDGYALQLDTGSAFNPFGPTFPLTAPESSGWSWVNQGSATVTTTQNAIYLSDPGTTSFQDRLYVRSAPSTPYTVKALFIPQIYPWGITSDSPASHNLAPSCGLAFYESSSGKVISFLYYCYDTATDESSGVEIYQGPSLEISKDNSVTSNNSQYENGLNIKPLAFSSGIWMGVEDDGTNLYFYLSANGQQWDLVDQRARGNFFTTAPNKVGIIVNGNLTGNAATPMPCSMLLLSWTGA